jgi:hypothetical protein
MAHIYIEGRERMGSPDSLFLFLLLYHGSQEGVWLSSF